MFSVCYILTQCMSALEIFNDSALYKCSLNNNNNNNTCYLHLAFVLMHPVSLHSQVRVWFTSVDAGTSDCELSTRTSFTRRNISCYDTYSYSCIWECSLRAGQNLSYPFHRFFCRFSQSVPQIIRACGSVDLLSSRLIDSVIIMFVYDMSVITIIYLPKV